MLIPPYPPAPEDAHIPGNTIAIYLWASTLAQIAKSTKASSEVMYFQGEHAIGAIRNVVAEIN